MLTGREWLAGILLRRDILMADVRFVDRLDRLADNPACRDYIARAKWPLFPKPFRSFTRIPNGIDYMTI